jgi:hypothetical protein
MTLIRVPDPTGSATRAGDFPGVKLALRADDSEIRGCLVYLESEYDPSTMARFAAIIAESVEPVEPAEPVEELPSEFRGQFAVEHSRSAPLRAPGEVGP